MLKNDRVCVTLSSSSRRLYRISGRSGPFFCPFQAKKSGIRQPYGWVLRAVAVPSTRPLNRRVRLPTGADIPVTENTDHPPGRTRYFIS